MPKRKPVAPRPLTDNNASLRQRSLRACDACHRRKRKCDGKFPCSSCRGYGYDCSYSDGKPPATTQRSGSFSSPDESAASQTNNGWHSNTPPTNASKDTEGLEGGAGTSHTPAAEAEDSPRVMMHKKKARYILANSAIAFPRVLGQDLNQPDPPRLHSYAWNMGIRLERHTYLRSRVCTYLTLDECQRLCETFFTIVHPVFSFLNQDNFLERLETYWTSTEKHLSFEALICSIAALGSFFSTPPHPREQDLVDQVRTIVEVSLSEPVELLNMDHLATCIARTLYQRLVTRPPISYLSSAMTMRVAELLGMHISLNDQVLASSTDVPVFERAEIEQRRRCFWIAWALNYLIATEYGKIPVNLGSISCEHPTKEPGTYTEQFVSLVYTLSQANNNNLNNLHDPTSRPQLNNTFELIQNIPDEPPLLSLFKADICLCLLRKLLSSRRRPEAPISTSAANIFQHAFSGIRTLLAQRQPWWNMLSIPFQSICVLLFLDCQPGLALLPEAVETLSQLAEVYNTHLAREAYETARRLIEMSRDDSLARSRMKEAALSNFAATNTTTAAPAATVATNASASAEATNTGTGTNDETAIPTMANNIPNYFLQDWNFNELADWSQFFEPGFA